MTLFFIHLIFCANIKSLNAHHNSVDPLQCPDMASVPTLYTASTYTSLITSWKSLWTTQIPIANALSRLCPTSTAVTWGRMLASFYTRGELLLERSNMQPVGLTDGWSLFWAAISLKQFQLFSTTIWFDDWMSKPQRRGNDKPGGMGYVDNQTPPPQCVRGWSVGPLPEPLLILVVRVQKARAVWAQGLSQPAWAPAKPGGSLCTQGRRPVLP